MSLRTHVQAQEPLIFYHEISLDTSISESTRIKSHPFPDACAYAYVATIPGENQMRSMRFYFHGGSL